MAMQITDTLKQLFAAQGVTANGATIDDILKSGFSQLNDAKVYGNLIADIIAQCAETGTFPGGGAAPTVVNEITWNGDTTGLETVVMSYDDTPITFYKVSDSVLPYALSTEGTSWGSSYEYSAADKDGADVGLSGAIMFNGGMTFPMQGEGYFYAVVVAYVPGVALSPEDPTVTFPSAGTWFASLTPDNYLSSFAAGL